MKVLNPTTFGTIVQFVLREGDRQTYCNRYNHNPHLGHADFHVYLEPDVGQRNIDCDPELSGFDTIVFQHDGYAQVQLCDGELRFDDDDRPALEYYFAILISHISSQG